MLSPRLYLPALTLLPSSALFLSPRSLTEGDLLPHHLTTIRWSTVWSRTEKERSLWLWHSKEIRLSQCIKHSYKELSVITQVHLDIDFLCNQWQHILEMRDRDKKRKRHRHREAETERDTHREKNCKGINIGFYICVEEWVLRVPWWLGRQATASELQKIDLIVKFSIVARQALKQWLYQTCLPFRGGGSEKTDILPPGSWINWD